MFSKYQTVSNLAISKIILGNLNIIYSVHSSLNVGIDMTLFSQMQCAIQSMHSHIF